MVMPRLKSGAGSRKLWPCFVTSSGHQLQYLLKSSYDYTPPLSSQLQSMHAKRDINGEHCLECKCISPVMSPAHSQDLKTLGAKYGRGLPHTTWDQTFSKGLKLTGVCWDKAKVLAENQQWWGDLVAQCAQQHERIYVLSKVLIM